MAEYYEIHDRVLDPFGKEMFDYGTRYSQHFLSRQVNRLLGVIENDVIVRGMDVSQGSVPNYGFQVSVDAGQVVHDQMYFVLPDPTVIEFSLYTRLGINGVNTTDNWFSVSGDMRTIFPQFTSFAVEGSTGNNDINWVVHHTEYTGGNTRIYVASNISNSTANGTIIRRNVEDTMNETARLICYTKFQYLKTPDTGDNKLQICLDYMALDGTIANGWDPNQNRILLAVFDIQRNSDNTETVPSGFRMWTPEDYEALTGHQQTFPVNGIDYEVSNDTDLADAVDGGVL